jgi:hypothetical protein
MKTILALLVVVALSVFCSCQKEQTEAERKAEIDREVQQRLDAEHQAQEKEQLAQRETELSAREKEVAQKESAATATQAPERETRSARTEQRTARIDERGPTASYNTFYTKLDRYGAWRETGDYGYVWQPREAEASRNWRPYTNGRWVYTDAGWTWISNEPFGWATYHYGRWTRLRNIGWVWVPGDEWAPAWVSWRKSNDYVGWAPLPPEARFDRRTGIHNWSDNYYDIGPDQYAFVPVNEFGAQRIESTVVPRERNVTIINQTTNVTNITYSNTTIINQGPDYDEARSRSREPIQRLRIQRETTVDFGAEGPRPMVRGEVVVVTAPVFAAPQRAERPPTVKETIAQAAVDLGWAAITNHQEAEKARAKMKSEAKAPADAPSKKFVKPTSESAPATEATGAPPTSTSSTAPAALAPTESASVTPLPKATEQPRSPARSAETPESVMTPTATPAPTTTPRASSSPTASPSVSPRQSRLLTPSVTPRRATPVPTSTSSVSTAASPGSSPSPTSTVSSAPPQSRNKREVSDQDRGTLPSKEISTPSPAASGSAEQGEQKRLRGIESQAQRFQPRRTVPMTSPASPTAPPTSTSLPTTSGASAPLASPAEKLTKKEKKEQKREVKDQKRERKEGAETSESVTPSPQSSP